MKRKYLILFFIIAISFVYSCKDYKKRKEIEKIVNEWTGKEILFPENISCYIAGQDTLPQICNTLFQREFKILLYVDSLGCSSCRLNLFEWKQLMEEADSLFQGNVGFLLFFQPKSERESSYLFTRDQFDYPVFIDINGTIDQLNGFPKEMDYQCFLLDSNNKVLIIGNPALNLNNWELYKSQISGEKKTKPEFFTTVITDKTVHNYGAILKNSSNPADFTITNTGDHPLVIHRISSSCGCTNADWDKRPIEPGKTATISIEMTPDEAGYFSKTIDVYCNINESPLKLMINGNVND